MIQTLDDAWSWYQSARSVAQLTSRLARKHWDALPWDGPIGKDDKLKELDSAELESFSSVVLTDLDDLCVLLLFSVFEAVMRKQVLSEVEAELPSLHHPFVKGAIDELRNDIEHGSFFRVLAPYKSDANHDMVEQVNQVRQYRNWVAHGRRGVQPTTVDPHTAYMRLSEFLKIISTVASASPAGLT